MPYMKAAHYSVLLPSLRYFLLPCQQIITVYSLQGK